ncbi:MAG: peptidylprolyl isomerase, partial [Bacteroidota bacterium]
QNIVGEIAGQKITLQEYQAQVTYMRNKFAHKAREAFVQAKAWWELIEQITYRKEYDALGLQVGADELVDMVQGTRIHSEVKDSFQDPETKQFDKQQLIDYLQTLPQAAIGQQARWYQFEHKIRTERKREKLLQLMQQSAYISALEAQAQYKVAGTTLSVQCLYVPYHTYPNDQVKVTDEMLQQYLEAHKEDYQLIETRSLQYLVFDVQPTEEDKHALQKELQNLRQAFAQAKDDYAFASINTDESATEAHLQLTAQQLPQALAQQKRRLKKGSVVGPVQEGDVYKLYKIAAIHPHAAQPYEVAVITKQLMPSDATRDQAFRKADYCASTVRNASQMAAYAVQEDLPVLEARVGPYNTHVGMLPQARVLVRWLYNDASLGQVSPVFELDDKYVVALMTDRTPAGTASLDQVRNEIFFKVLQAQKAYAIMAQLQSTPGLPLEEIAAQYGDGARILEVNNLGFEEDVLQSAGMARRAIGAAFALQPGKRTAVADDNGVLIVVLKDKKDAAPLEALVAYQQDLAQIEGTKQRLQVVQSMEELSNIKDERYRFF